MKKLLGWLFRQKAKSGSPFGRALLHRGRRGLLGRQARFEAMEGRAMLSWTVMAFLDGDNDLENALLGDFLEMSAVGSQPGMNIVAQLDRIAGYDNSFDDWTGTRRGVISFGDTPSAAWGTDLGEVNMGDIFELADFVQWAIANYPADHYALILSDHGAGIDGVCYDETSGNDAITMGEVATFAALLGGSSPLDLIAFDACLMGMVEVGYQIRDLAHVMVGSEELIPGTGFDYTPFLAQLAANPNMTAQTLGNNIVGAYAAFYGPAGTETLSSIDLAQLGSATTGLVGALERFSNWMLDFGSPIDWAALTAARDASQKFGVPGTHPFRDLGDIMTRFQASFGVNPLIAHAAGQVLTALDAAVLRNYAGSGTTANGLSIYYPAAEPVMPVYYMGDVRLTADMQWANVVHAARAFLFPQALVPGAPTGLFVGGGNCGDSITIVQLPTGQELVSMSLRHFAYNLTPSPDGTIFVFGRGGCDTIVLTSTVTHNSRIEGGDDSDKIVSSRGDDILFGGRGNDVLMAGAGNDVLSGGEGHDTLYGQEGDDELEGGLGNDVLMGGAGSDLISGGEGHDTLYGQEGDDVLDGGEGNDVLFAGAGSDIAVGGEGHDMIAGEQGDDFLVGGDGNDVIVECAGFNFLYGDAGNDTLVGGNNGDIIVGGEGADVLTGAGGDDLIYGDEGNDTIDGGAGNDVLRGGDGNDFITGGSGNDVVIGDAGNDRLYGGLGRDLLIGGTGADWLFGLHEEDILIGGTTLHDANDVALLAIMAEWTAPRPIATRINNLTFGGGANGPFTLVKGVDVLADVGPNDLYGGTQSDWFFAFANDRLRDVLPDDQVV